MFYKFPIIEHLDQVREAIKGRDEFIIAERGVNIDERKTKQGNNFVYIPGDYIVVNYVVCLVDTFPEPNTKDGALNIQYCIKRECRGLIFDACSNKVISRAFGKFFNINERAETESKNIDLSKPHVILDKVDGSFIRPFKTSDGMFRVGTKMGETDIADIARPFFDKSNYRDLSEWCFERNLTPIFELTGRENRVVIDYGDKNELTLLAIRHNVTGEYIKY